MNKNFEDAYKTEVQQNIPDLWNRIESSLPEKKVAGVVEHKKEVKVTNTGKGKKKSPYVWMKWASLAAAAVLILLMLPAAAGVGIIWGVVNAGKGSSDMAATESCTTDGAAEDIYVADQMADEECAEEEVFDESPAMDNQQAENDMDSGASMMESAKEENNEDAFMQTMPSGNESEEIYENAELLTAEMPVTVTGYTVGSDAEYYRVFMTIPEDMYPFFEGREEFQNGELEVRVYYDDSEAPEAGEEYLVDVYEVRTAMSDTVPYCLIAELK